MTNSNHPDPTPNEPTPPSNRCLGSRIWRSLLVLSGVTLVIGVAGTLGVRYFIFNRLGPLVETSLSTLINRPLEIGEVNAFSLRGITIDGVAIPATADDSDYATVETVRVGFNLLTVVSELIRDRQLPITITLINPDTYLEENEPGQWLDLDIQIPEEDGPIEIVVDTIRIQDARATLAPYPQLDSTGSEALTNLPAAEAALTTALPLEPVVVQHISGTINLRNDNQLIAFDATGEPLSGGKFATQGEVDLAAEKINAVLRSNQLELASLSRLLPLPLSITAGVLDSNMGIQVNLAQIETVSRAIAFNGTANLQNVVANLDAAPQPIRDLNSRLRFQGQTITLEETRLQYDQIPVQAAGSLDLTTGYNLTAAIPRVDLEDLQETLNFSLGFPTAGAFRSDVRIIGALTQPQILGTVRNIEPIQADRVSADTFFARFVLTPPALDVPEIRIIPTTGGQIIGQGRANLEADGELMLDFDVDVPGDAIATTYGAALPQGYQIGSVLADISVSGTFDAIEAVAQWRLPTATYPGQGEIRYATSTVQLQNTQFVVEGGRVNAEAIAQIDTGNWQATVSGSQVAVNRFSTALEGVLDGNVRLAGNFNNFDLRTLQAAGEAQITNAQVQIPDSPPLLDPGTWSTRFQWAGNGVDVQELTAPGLSVNGFIGVDLQDTPSISNLDLAIALQNYRLERLAAFIPATVQDQLTIQGAADFRGQLTGALETLNIAGNLSLSDLALNEFAFDSTLTGNAAFALGRGGQIDLVGADEARIAATLDDRYLPRSFFIRNDDVVAQGETDGTVLQARVENFPLAVLNLRPAEAQGLGQVTGTLNGNITADLADLSNPTVLGAVAIARPALGYISAESFTGRIRYGDGSASLTDGELRFAESLYRLAADVTLEPTLNYQARLIAAPGRIEDLLATLQVSDFSDLSQLLSPVVWGDASDLQTTPVGQPAAPLYDADANDQLDYFSTILARLEQQQTELDQAIIPPLDTLQGEFTGEIVVAGSAAAGVTADINLAGENWVWGPYDPPNQFEVAASYEDGTATLMPVRFQSEDTLISAVGQVGLGSQDAELVVENVPVEWAEALVDLPFEAGGTLNARVALGGNLNNPQADGNAAIANASLNQTPLDEAQVEFRYTDARLDFDGAIIAEPPERLTFSGSVPYPLAFASVQPMSDRLQLRANLRDEGLALLNIITQDQITWEGGSGAVTIAVDGTLEQPQVVGTAQFTDGILSSALLENNITNVNGTVLFNFDTIEVESLQARLGGGAIAAQGTLPIFAANASSASDSLAVSIRAADINFQDLLTGEVNGKVTLAGAALQPIIGGAVGIRNGRINARNITAGDTPTTTVAIGDAENPEASFASQILFDNFRVSLDNNLLIAGQPLFNITALGDLSLNGSLQEPEPAGVVRLTSGWINLFTTQFRLDTSIENTATFIPRSGLDPILNVQMTANVREVNREPVPPSSPFAASEVADQSSIPTFGGIETVVVEARVVGPASELSENLELTSQPSRSDDQLVALIGGGFVNTLASGDTALALANYFGAGAFSTFGNQVANALGLSEFRIFPTTDASGESRTPLTIGVEAVVDLTRNFSISALQILNSGNPPQFGVRYRLTDDLQIRGSSDFEDDSRAILEYRIRF